MFKKCAKPARSPLDRIVHPVYCSNSTTVLCVWGDRRNRLGDR